MILIILGVMAGFVTLVWLIAELRLLMDKDRVPTPADLERAALAFKALAAVLGTSLVAVATWIGHFAWRVQRTAVFPPPGSRQLRVRRVLRGAEALRVAYLCYAVAGILMMLGIAVTPVAFHLMKTLRL